MGGFLLMSRGRQYDILHFSKGIAFLHYKDASSQSFNVHDFVTAVHAKAYLGSVEVPKPSAFQA